MSATKSPLYTRPPDLREQDYQSFQADALLVDGTTELLSEPGVNKSWQVHYLVIVSSIADAGGTLAIKSGGGLVLFKMALDVVGVVPVVFGEYPWGFTIAADDTLTAVIAGATATDVSIQGYATS